MTILWHAAAGGMGLITITRPTLSDYATDQVILNAMAQELFAMILSNKIKLALHQTHPLTDAALAHDAFAQLQTTSATVLLP